MSSSAYHRIPYHHYHHYGYLWGYHPASLYAALETLLVGRSLDTNPRYQDHLSSLYATLGVHLVLGYYHLILCLLLVYHTPLVPIKGYT